MNSTLRSVGYIFAATLSLGLFGCSNVGDAPMGSTPQQAVDQFNAMKPEDQIKMIQTSPMPAAQKAAKIAEIKQKNGLK